MGPEAALLAKNAPHSAEPTNAELATLLAGGNPSDNDAAADDAEEGEGPEESPDQDDPEMDDEPADEPDGEDDEESDEEGVEAEASEDDPAADDDDDDATEQEPEDEDKEAAKKIRAKFTPEQQKLFDRAQAKKARRIAELRTEAERLKKAVEAKDAELEAARSKTPATSPASNRADPLAAIDDEAALEKRVAEYKELRRWARTHPQGGTIGDQEVTAERAAELLDDADEIITEHAPRHRERLRQRAAGEAEAIKAVPALKDKTSEVAVNVAAKLREWGDLRLRDIPAVKLMLADYVAGRTQRLNAAKPSADKKKVAPKAPAAPAGGARPPKVSPGVKATTGASKTLEATGDDPDNAVLRALIIPRR